MKPVAPPALLAQLLSEPKHTAISLRNLFQGLPRDGADVPVAVHVVVANGKYLRKALLTPVGSKLERVREVAEPPALVLVVGRRR